MKLSKILVPLFFLLTLSACLSAQQEYIDLESKTIDVENAQSILIQIDGGELAISGVEGNQLEVGGRAVYPAEVDYRIEDSGEQIIIYVQDQHRRLSKNLVQINIIIPKGIKVKVESDAASVFVERFSGELEVASTSGNVTVENTSGNLVLRSNRGNVTVKNCSGDISMVGNYGTLSARDNEGRLGISTIMGTVVFGGAIQENDTVSLETDHGPVEVNLKPDSHLTLAVRSTSGDVACMLPDISSTSRTCDGQVGTGNGELKIRTVSGAVTIRLIP